MTYAQLKEQLSNMTPSALQNDVTVYFEEQDEYYPIYRTSLCIDGVLDDGHLCLVVDNANDED